MLPPLGALGPSAAGFDPVGPVRVPCTGPVTPVQVKRGLIPAGTDAAADVPCRRAICLQDHVPDSDVRPQTCRYLEFQ